MTTGKLAFGFAHFSSCSGCQLMLLNCEMELAGLGDVINCMDFGLLDSRHNGQEDLDLMLVEGSISSPRELESLLDLRQRSRWLVAVGSCAVTGGVNRFQMPDHTSASHLVYGPAADAFSIFPARPVEDFVDIDWWIPGCPPERNDFLEMFGALRCGSWPTRRQSPVCMECRIRENRCLLEEDHMACLGPVTRSGCAARCPSIMVPCEGCRGEVDEANRDELYRLLLETGWSDLETSRRLQKFSGGGSD